MIVLIVKRAKYSMKKVYFQFWIPSNERIFSHCNYKFEKEPGYFFGAMNIDYGLTVAQGIATYVIAKFFFIKTCDLRIIAIIAMVIIAMAFINIRLSRILWIYMFKNYSM